MSGPENNVLLQWRLHFHSLLRRIVGGFVVTEMMCISQGIKDICDISYRNGLLMELKSVQLQWEFVPLKILDLKCILSNLPNF